MSLGQIGARLRVLSFVAARCQDSPYAGDTDVDFIKQMRTHHLAAIDMAKIQLPNGKLAESPALRPKSLPKRNAEIAN